MREADPIFALRMREDPRRIGRPGLEQRRGGPFRLGELGKGGKRIATLFVVLADRLQQPGALLQCVGGQLCEILAAIIADGALVHRLQQIEAAGALQTIAQVDQQIPDHRFAAFTLAFGGRARLEREQRQQSGDEHPDQGGDRHRGDPADAALRVALHQLVEPDIGQHRDELEQRQPRSVAVAPEIRRQWLERLVVGPGQQQRRVEGGGAGPLVQRGEDRLIAVKAAEQLHLAPDPFGLCRVRRADDDQMSRGGDRRADRIGQVGGGGELVAIAEQRLQPPGVAPRGRGRGCS